MFQKQNPPQVKDDLSLLELMLEDSKSASSLFQPRHYWIDSAKSLSSELHSKGLHDFRRRKNSVLTAFGATDDSRKSVFVKSLYNNVGVPLKIRILHFFLRNVFKNSALTALIFYISNGYSGITEDDLKLFCYEFAKSYGKEHDAKPISEFEGSLVGNPESVIKIGKKIYTIPLLNFYIRYAYCCSHIDFNSINSMAEIGVGSGKQIEVIKKLHPHINFYCFDIPPPLYVAEQYLSALFPDSVVSYRETRKLKRIPENEKGKIYIFEPQQLSQIENMNYDFFFNAQSFHEIDPETVLNYLKYINKQTNKSIFIGASITGKDIGSKSDKHGILENTTLNHYKSGLKDFELIDSTERLRLPRLTNIKNNRFMFWCRK